MAMRSRVVIITTLNSISRLSRGSSGEERVPSIVEDTLLNEKSESGAHAAFSSAEGHFRSPSPCCRDGLLAQLADQVEEGKVHADDDAAHGATQEQDHHRLHQGQEVGHRLVHLLLVEVRDLAEHGVEGARLLA